MRNLSGRLVLLVGAIAIAIVIVASALGSSRTSEGFPAWLEATSTFAAFTAASVAVFFAMKTQQLESRREYRIESALVREQASKVAAWYGNQTAEPSPATGQPSIRGRLGITFQGVHLRNASDLPVSSVLVALTEGPALMAVFRVGVVPPAANARFESLSSETASLVTQRRGERYEGWKPDVAVAFIDAGGAGWVRGPTGRLENVSPEIVYDPSHGSLWGSVGLS